MKSPIARKMGRYPVVNVNDEVTDFVFGDESLDNLAEGIYHRGTHIFSETFGGRFIIQKINGKINSSAFGHTLAYEAPLEGAKRIIEDTFRIRVSAIDIEAISVLSPCDETQGEIVRLYSYLLNLDKELIKANTNVDSVIICPLDKLLEDMYNYPDDYDPLFPVLMNMFLTMYRS